MITCIGAGAEQERQEEARLEEFQRGQLPAFAKENQQVVKFAREVSSWAAAVGHAVV